MMNVVWFLKLLLDRLVLRHDPDVDELDADELSNYLVVSDACFVSSARFLTTS